MIILIIEGEKIAGLEFPVGEVLDSKQEIKQRRIDAYQGMLLGILHKNKVKIIFEDNEGIKQVETTIFGYTDHSVFLKKGLKIPLHRIHKIIT